MKTLARDLAAVLIIGMALLLSGCVSDVVLVNPRTGETDACAASLRGFNPWSEQEACIGDHIAGGWVRKER